jgi:Na+/phosphate symporter
MTGFAAGGLIDLTPALAVMLGANIGTTLIVQALSFNVAEFAPALIFIGVRRMDDPRSRTDHAGVLPCRGRSEGDDGQRPPAGR